MRKWRDVPLTELGQFSSGKSIKPGLEGPVRAFGSNGVIGGAPEARHARGVIVGRVGAYCGSVEVSHEPFWASDNTIVVEPIDATDLDFLYYLLLWADLNQHAGGAAQPLLTQTTLKSLTFSVPSLSGRSKISSVLRALDDLIENNRRRIDLLEKMARAIYREWFIFFRYPGHENVPLVDSPVGSIPEDWEVAVLGSLADLRGGSTMTKQDYTSLGFTAFSASGPDGYLPDFEVDSKGVVLSAVGARCGRTFRAAGKWSSIANTIKILPTPSRCRSAWLTLSLEDPSIFPKRGSAQPFVSINDARRILLVAPSVACMDGFERVAGPMFELVDAFTSAVRTLAGARDLLLPRLLSGKIDVSDLDLSVLIEAATT